MCPTADRLFGRVCATNMINLHTGCIKVCIKNYVFKLTAYVNAIRCLVITCSDPFGVLKTPFFGCFLGHPKTVQTRLFQVKSPENLVQHVFGPPREWGQKGVHHGYPQGVHIVWYTL